MSLRSVIFIKNIGYIQRMEWEPDFLSNDPGVWLGRIYVYLILAFSVCKFNFNSWMLPD